MLVLGVYSKRMNGILESSPAKPNDLSYQQYLGELGDADPLLPVLHARREPGGYYRLVLVFSSVPPGWFWTETSLDLALGECLVFVAKRAMSSGPIVVWM